MTTFVIIPVKGLDEAKSRLSPLLFDNERKEFCLKMLEDVLVAVKTMKDVQQTLVVSADPLVLRVAKNFDAVPFKESQPSLNQAISEAIRWCIQRGAGSVLILPADIPAVAPMDLNRIFSLGKKAAMVISPSRSEDGTNALFLTPSNAIPTFYGRHSFQRHIEEVSMRGIRYCVAKSRRIALDIDTNEDLADFLASDPGKTHVYEFLKKTGVFGRLKMDLKLRVEIVK